tara:strand:- start:1909 stop:2199 length:291 start_codon:yes stop_codon:yes gene_type:complete
MSPKERKQLKILRKKLDILDNSFIKLLKKRSLLVDKVLKLKKYKNQIVDKKRIKIILKKIKIKSINNNIDPKVSKRIWKNMIHAFINYERRNFKSK